MINSLDEYIEIVAGHVCDNDKIVTYKWLSKELEVHVNLAKQILWEFVQRHGQEGNIQCTYLLMGTLADGGLHVEVVKDVDLENAKKKFTRISAEHIYSLQKSLPDIDLLAISGEGDVRFSAIKCKENVERTDEEMHVLRWGCLMPSGQLPVAPVQTGKAEHEPIAKAKMSPESSKEKSTPFGKNTAAQKKGFNNLFGKANTKQKSPVEKTDTSAKTVSSNGQISQKQGTSALPKKKVQKGGLNAFFEQAKKENTTNKDEGLSGKVEENNVFTQKEEEKEGESEVQIISPTKVSSKKKSRGKKRNRSKDTNSSVSKRKRIMVFCGSSDSENNSCEEVIEEIDLEPSPPKKSPVKNRTPSPPPVKTEGGKRKVLKVVDKIFEEDGYFVTKKVHVYESCSEDEIEAKVETKKPSPPESRLDAKAKKNTKQTTLMNFFKKS